MQIKNILWHHTPPPIATLLLIGQFHTNTTKRNYFFVKEKKLKCLNDKCKNNIDLNNKNDLKWK